MIKIILILLGYFDVLHAQVDSILIKKIEIFNQEIDNAVVKKDIIFLEKSYAEDFVFSHGTGLIEGKENWLKTVKDSKNTYISRTNDSIIVELHPDIILLRGRLTVKKAGKNGQSNYQLWYVRAYSNRKKRWQLISHRTTEEKYF